MQPADREAPSVPQPGPLYRSVAGLAFGIMRAQRWAFDHRGIDNVPATGGAVIAANHNSFWDFFTIGRGPYVELGRPVRILAKESLFRVPLFGRVMHAAGHIPVHRGSGAAALSSAVDALQRGELVLVLPEQTISPSFELLSFKHGAARMAQMARVPLIPAASWGSHRFHTVGRRPRWSWRLPVVTSFGAPVPTAGRFVDDVTADLHQRVGGLLDDCMATYPDGMPADAWWVPVRLGGTAPTPEEAAEHVRRLATRWRPAGRRQAS